MKKNIIIWILALVLITNVAYASNNKVIYKFSICGQSMYPAINKGSQCSYMDVVTTNKEQVKINDVVCYNYYKEDFIGNFKYICHRVIRLEEEHFCTKGDNNLYEDNCMEYKYLALKVLV